MPGKTKDTTKYRDELQLLCIVPELKKNETTGKYLKASYSLDRDVKRVLCEWISRLKFPDGYMSNINRCVDKKELKMRGMKSHDYNVSMQCLLPIAFRELLPHVVWKAITELSIFFKDFTSRTIKIEDMCRLHEIIPVTLCQLERIFPSSFFDSMEHLVIHLVDEAHIAGPIQYRWMYPFERYMKTLKDFVKNKAKVEGSITNAYLMKEASTFSSYYFEDWVTTKIRNVPQNDDGRADE